MSWGFGGIAANNPQGGGATANAGSELEAIETEQLGFQALNGERKIRLYSSPWPLDGPPSKTASLLSIANGRKLLAAAGPDTLNLFDTDAVRAAFSADGKEKIRDLSPKLSVSVPRLSQIAFTSDESALVITAEQGGGLAIYDTGAASSGWTSAFQIPTQNTAVRHLLPNPNPEASHLVAVVLEDGNFLIADLKSKAFVTGSGGTVLKQNVSCASWSKKGRQIVAGLADGTAVQLDTQGNVKDTLPRPPAVEDLPVTGIYWLENLEFLVIHSPVANQANDDDAMSAMTEVFIHLVFRDKDTKVCSFHRFLVDPCPPFMDNRLPPHHYIQRIRDWQPNLDDTLILACTASTDVGTFTRSKIALSQDLPAEQITHAYTTTSFTDTRRAALPMAANDIDDTYPIGVVLDLSSVQTVSKPIPNDETLDESPIPLPELCILNQEGVLSAWWYVYNEAIRAKQAAPGMSASVTAQQSGAISQSSTTPAKPAFGSSGFGQTSQTPTQPALGQPSQPAFGSPASGQPSQTPARPAFGSPAQTSAQPAFGTTTTTPQFGQPAFGATSKPGFGTPSGLGSTASPWAAKTDQPKSTFGAPSQLGLSTGGTAFGQSGGTSFGKPSVWGSPATQPTSTFGQPSAFSGAKPAASPFAAFAQQHKENTAKAGTSPFAGVGQNNTAAAASPFASFGSQSKASPFATQAKPGMPSETSFGSTVTLSSNNGSFGSGSTFSPAKFGQPSQPATSTAQDKAPATGLNGFGGFKLGSTFKGDGSAKDDLPKPDNPGQSLFGSAFGTSLNDTTNHEKSPPPVIKQEIKDVSLKDIPEAAPLPPDFTAKAKPSEDAPLPPDFTAKAKPAEEAPLPPDFALPSVENAPAPPDFTSKSSKEPASDTSDLPLPPDPSLKTSSKTKPSGATQTPLSPAESEDDDDDDNDHGEDDEFEGIEDDDDDLEEDDDAEGDWEDDQDDGEEDADHTPQIVNQERLDLFKSRITPASPKTKDDNEQSTTPETLQKPSFTPTGFPKVSVAFPPPQATQESPRSPSPVRAERAVTSPVRLPQQQQTKAAPQQNTSAKLKSSTGKSSLFQPRPSPPPVEQLEDDEDSQTRQILAAPIEPTLSLSDFLAHQDYTGKSNKEGIAGQLECVYRDVNSMIDTLGLNARALQAFLAGHGQISGDLTVNSLETADDWKLGDMYGLEKLQVDIDDRLEAEKLTDIPAKVDEIAEQDEQLSRLTLKAAEVRKQLALRTDPEKRAQQQASALPHETAAQQAELRQNVQQVQKLLAKVEESMSILRADLASIAAVSTESNGTAMPTVEAVTKTILKMTAMIEKKSGDIDLLEAQIRKLPGGANALGMSASYEDGLIDSLAASRLSNGTSTPSRGRFTSREPGLNSMFGPLGVSVTSLMQSTSFDPSASFLGRSTTSLQAVTRKKMSEITTEEVSQWRARAHQRREVLGAFRRVVEKAGQPRIIKANDRSA